MLIVLCLYIVLVWLVFSRLKLVRWGWGSGTVTVLTGALMLSVFLALFNHLTPSGSVIVASRVIEAIPNVGSMRGAESYPAVISIPKDYDKTDLRLGMPGTATAFAPNAGVIGNIKYILVWINSYTAYL